MWSVGTERPCVGRGGLEGRASAGSARAERVRSLGAISGSLSPFVLFIVLTAHIDSSPVILAWWSETRVVRTARDTPEGGCWDSRSRSAQLLPNTHTYRPSP